VQQRSAGQIRDNRRVSSSAGPGGRPDVRVFKLRASFQFGGRAVRPGLEGPPPSAGCCIETCEEWAARLPPTYRRFIIPWKNFP